MPEKRCLTTPHGAAVCIVTQFTEKVRGMSLSKKDQKIPSRATGTDEDASRFAAAVAAALHQAYDDSGSAIKVVAGLTATSERTVKNWFSGHSGPRGDHLIKLMAKSNGMLDAFLTMAGRSDLLAYARIADLAERLTVILRSLNDALHERSDDADRE
jgi:hypothetical protein